MDKNISSTRNADDYRLTFEKKQKEEALRGSEERLRAFMTASSDIMYRMSPDWSTMTELYGKGFLADTGEPDQCWLDKYIHPDDQESVIEVIQKCIREKRTFELEHRVLRADGSTGWTQSRAVPLFDDKGEIKEWFGAASDITERKKAEVALRESEKRQTAEHQRLLDVLETLPAMVCLPPARRRMSSMG